jgi:hypothetical protein
MIENPLFLQNQDTSNQSSEAVFQEYDVVYGDLAEKKTQETPNQFLYMKLVICCLFGIILILSIWLCHAYDLF